MSRRFPIEIAGFCDDIIRELCEILPDVHIFTMRDARHNNTYIFLDWTTEYVCMDYTE